MTMTTEPPECDRTLAEIVHEAVIRFRHDRSNFWLGVLVLVPVASWLGVAAGLATFWAALTRDSIHAGVLVFWVFAFPFAVFLAVQSTRALYRYARMLVANDPHEWIPDEDEYPKP